MFNKEMLTYVMFDLETTGLFGSHPDLAAVSQHVRCNQQNMNKRLAQLSDKYTLKSYDQSH
jgi:DNA polymerase III alpha subunit (gram-positive type)